MEPGPHHLNNNNDNNKRWSVRANPRTTSLNAMQGMGTKISNRLDSTNSDDGFDDGMNNTSMHNNANYGGGEGGVEVSGVQELGGGPMMAQVNDDPDKIIIDHDNDHDFAPPRGHNYEEDPLQPLGTGGGADDYNNGSDVSSVDKYADRNSDPGVGADCSLPMLDTPLAVNGMGMNMAMGGFTNAVHHSLSVGNLPTGASHVTATMNTMTMGGGGGTNRTLSSGLNLNHHNNNPSGAESVSLGTATQTHEVRMPMHISTFKPATGCTNASDFIVRCFVARLRSGITVVKHGRSRWCKSRLRILHVHPDGRSLSWKPALGEPSSGKRPPKLDLSTCKEVRHAWSPDPENPMFTGTPILRQKCEAANAHKSFALIFPKRTVDITAVTADQCKVLMEGFSALCFRLQVANAATANGEDGNGNGNKVGGGASNNKKVGEDVEEDRATASVTLTNTSTMGNSSPGKMIGLKKRSFR